MPFSIGGLIQGALGVSQVLGAFTGGGASQVGPGILTRRQGKILAGQPVKSLTTGLRPGQTRSIVGGGGAAVLPGGPRRDVLIGAGTLAASFIPSLFNGNGRTVGSILAAAREATGRSATSRAIRLAARVCGLETAADTFGISTEDVCFIVVNSGRRRARGISAADLRKTRSTLRKLNTMRKSVRSLFSTR